MNTQNVLKPEDLVQQAEEQIQIATGILNRGFYRVVHPSEHHPSKEKLLSHYTNWPCPGISAAAMYRWFHRPSH